VTGYKKYPSRSSEVSNEGDIPHHWTRKRLGHFVVSEGGGTPSRVVPSYWNGSIAWVTPKDMKREFLNDSEEKITEAGLQDSAAALIEAGRVLLVMRSGILRHTIPVAVNTVPLTVNQDLRALDTSSELDPSFFLRYVQGLNSLLLSQWSKQGATVESLEYELIRRTLIPIPPREEQRWITTYLDREIALIDKLIEKKTRFVTLLSEKQQALITHAVTKGLDPHAKMKDSGVRWLGKVPEHWSVARLKYSVSSIEQGWSPQCEARPATDQEWGVLKVGCVNGGKFSRHENKALPVTLEPRPELAIRKGDVLVSRANTRELVGSCAVVHEDQPRLLLCDKLYRLRANEGLDPEMLALLISVLGRREVEVEANGASSSMVNISQEVILNLAVAIPTYKEQRAILGYLHAESKKLSALNDKTKRSVELLTERRTALITAAVTGQIDVREELA
jgi:type I restriction enzyme S subunit